MAIVCLLAPVPAAAGIDTTVAAPESLVCTVSSMSISLGAPIGMLSTQFSGIQGPQYGVSGAGVCSGMNGTETFGFTGNGSATGQPTCVDFVSSGGNGSVTLNGQPYAASFDIVGPAASGQWVMVVGTSQLGSEGGGVAELYMEPATLAACAEGAGTTTLNYTGTVVLAL